MNSEIKMHENADRIFEAYNDAMGKDFGKETRDRIHWICNQAKGEHILDIGCSQGVACILLGREGKQVLGIDIDPRSIEYANNVLLQDYYNIKENVTFLCADFMKYDFQGKKFDSVILTEVLEHLTDPKRLIDHIQPVLKPSGRLIISVPLGLNSYFDHKKSYYVLDIIEEIEEYYDILTYKITHRNINLICTKRTNVRTEPLQLSRGYVQAIEKGLEQKEQSNEKILVDTRERLKQIQLTVQNEKAELSKKMQTVQNEKAELSRKIQIVQHEKAELSRKLQTTARQLQQSQKERTEFSKKLYKAHHNKWYKFGQLSRKRKIWTAGRTISKKLHIYWLLRPFAKLVKKVFNKKKNSMSIKTKQYKPQNNTNDFSQKTRIKKSLSELNVLLIADEFTYNNMVSLFNNLILPTPDNYKEMLTTHNIDLFFCESAWQGNAKTWEHKISNAGFRDNTELKKLVSKCKQKGIPTIFWNKEDPFHFNSFLDSAKVFDFVYTSCGDSVKKYQAAGCKQVNWAPFFFSPKIFNPVQEIPRQEKTVFSGAYYPGKYPERAEFIDLFPSMFTPKELVIYDRNYNNKDNINQFPELFKPYIVGHLPATEIKRAYKGYKIALNANSITNSQTMFARRVIETLACNTPIISSEADSIKHLFGNIIVSSNNQEEIQQEVERLFKDSDYYREKCLKGVQEVFRKYTNVKVVENMISHTPINLVKEKSDVGVISHCTNSEEVHNAIALFVSQHVDVDCTLHMFIPYYDGYEKEFNKYNSDGIYMHPIDYIQEIDNISEIIQAKYIVIMSPGERYSTYYIQDFLNGYQYIHEDIILTQYVGKEYSFVSHINPKRFMSPTKSLPPEMVRAFMLQSQNSIKQQAFNINN